LVSAAVVGRANLLIQILTVFNPLCGDCHFSPSVARAV